MSAPEMETRTTSETYRYLDIPSTPQVEQCTLIKNTVTQGEVITSQRVQINITHPYYLSADVSLDQMDSLIGALNYIKNNMP